MTRIIASFAAAAALLTAGPALATGPTATTVKISLAGLDLSKASDVRELDHRIAKATEAVCGSYLQARDGEDGRIAQCRAAVTRQIEPQLAALRAETRIAQR